MLAVAGGLDFLTHGPFQELLEGSWFPPRESWVILLFKMDSKHGDEVLSSVPRHKKAVMCFREKTHVLDKLPSGMNYSAADSEFDVNESTIYIKDVFKQKHT